MQDYPVAKARAGARVQRIRRGGSNEIIREIMGRTLGAGL
jgi:hypothetical protein